ncbi:hypothetical protein DCAR_0100264 [Daucus carota subsp. sativus]|uniref:Uncharacterized protein n=1 Tax=Daucus carota subsp. sativus TaxID=79200 RepID=A0A166GUE2_DAUCS|nr:hypothetical protein DCAR_0100264 [Daucus carota subsp. sativus]
MMEAWGRCSLFDSQTAPYKYFVQGERAELQCLAKCHTSNTLEAGRAAVKDTGAAPGPLVDPAVVDPIDYAVDHHFIRCHDYCYLRVACKR